MPVTFNVRFWKIEKYSGRTATTYAVRWSVDGRSHKRRFATKAMAESFRSELMIAVRKGEAFDTDAGRPISMLRRKREGVTWYEFACKYVDMKWKTISPKHRKGIAEALVTVTPAMLTASLDPDSARRVRSALLNWGYTTRRGSTGQPDQVTDDLAWVESHSRPLADFSRAEVVRSVLELIVTRLDGGRAAGHPASVKRANVSTALNYAVELGLLEVNPLKAIRWAAPKSTQVVDRRVVVNPVQARALLAAVATMPKSGKRYAAFFACLYYSGLRPEEAANIRASNLSMPAKGWGWITLEAAAPETDVQWSDTGSRRQERQLKHRAVGESRRVPVPPQLVLLLQTHLEEHGTAADGRLFRSATGGPLPSVTYRRLWNRARLAVLTPEQYVSPLARRPYDLRHAAVSTWLNGGVAPVQVAEWAGHSVSVLLRIYARCLDGGEQVALRRIDDALGD